jgi:hypothetical protein
MSIGEIIEGHVNELLGKNKDLSQTRLEICMQCPICLMTALGPVCDRTKYINEKDEVSNEPKIGFIRGCGCRLEAKVTIKRDHCIRAKW